MDVNISETEQNQQSSFSQRRFFMEKENRLMVTPYAFHVDEDLLGRPLAKPWQRLWALCLDLVIVVCITALPLSIQLLAFSYVLWKLPRNKTLEIFSNRRVANYQLLFQVTAAVFLVTGLAGMFEINGAMFYSLIPAYLFWQLSNNKKPRLFSEERMAKYRPWFKGAAVLSLAIGLILILDVQDNASWAGFSGISFEKNITKIDIKAEYFSLSMLYFVVLPALWHGQTLGKRMVGIKIYRLDGKPLTLWEYTERYGGYAAGIATGFTGFAQLFWDHNRQAIQDKIAHTVVVKQLKK